MKTFEIKGKSYVLESDVMELQNENELFSAAIFSADMRELKIQAEIAALKTELANEQALAAGLGKMMQIHRDQVDALKVTAKRYETLRRLNVVQFQALYTKALQSHLPFDELVDLMGGQS